MIALLLALAFVAVSAQPAVVLPTVVSQTEWYSSPYWYRETYYHHKQYLYSYETCSQPPSSIEVCLSTVFSSIESSLSTIASSLASHEVSIKSEMHHEHTLLYSEISWVADVSGIAKSVKNAVDLDYGLEEDQISNLQDELQQINDAYDDLANQLLDIEGDIQNVRGQKSALYAKYKEVRVAKWSVYDAISAIVYEKDVIAKEQVQIEYVVERLNAQMQEIAEKVSQLNKRQSWLVSWEDKLYVDLSAFESNVREFKAVEADIEDRQEELYDEQGQLLADAQAVQDAMAKLKAEAVNVQSELGHLEGYQYLIESLQESVSYEAYEFISAYEEFTCEDSLLYYEACSSKAVVAAPPSVSVSVSVPAVAAKAAAPAVPAAAAKAPAGKKPASSSSVVV